MVNPKRTVEELKELRALTSDENGAQRVAFTPTWAKAREWLRKKVEGIRGVEIHNDAAGNFWATLQGKSPKALLIGGHIDSVPNGGWLDGCLNTLAGVEILRRIAAQYEGKPPVTVRLVDWADEEGARFGKSLFGSSACSGNLDMNEARALKDKDGIALPDAVKEHGIDFERVKDCRRELKNAAAYIELHIEQGPVLLDLDLPLGTVLGTFGVERHAITFHGQAAHSGSTPMNRRKDAFLAAAKMSPEIYRIAERSNGGVCTIRFLPNETRDRHQRGGRLPNHARSAPSRCEGARANVEGSEGSERAFCEGGQRYRLLGTNLADRTHPL